MNYFGNATAGLDKVTQDDRDLWDAAVDACTEHLQTFIDSEEMDPMYNECYETAMVDLLDCKSDGAIDSDDVTKMLIR